MDMATVMPALLLFNDRRGHLAPPVNPNLAEEKSQPDSPVDPRTWPGG